MEKRNDIVEELKQVDQQVVKFLKELHEPETLIIPSKEVIESIKAKLNTFRNEVLRIKSEVSESEIYSIWVDHLLELLDSSEIVLEESLRHPSKYVRSLGYCIHSVLMGNTSIEDKLKKLKNITDTLQRWLDALLDLTQKAPDDRVKRAIGAAEGILKEVNRCIDTYIHEVLQAKPSDRQKYYELLKYLAVLGENISSYIVKAEGVLGKERELMEDIAYEEYVEKAYRLPLNWIAKWYTDELTQTIRRFEELAYSINPNKKPLETLRETIHAPYRSADEMFRDLKEFLDIAKVHAKRVLDIPEEVVCEVTGVKEFERDIYPMGYAGVPDPLKKEVKCRVALNQYNYKAFSRGWLMMMAIHEAYYGHNIHWIKVGLADIPESFKVNSSIGAPLSEGLALRGEELLQDIYNDKTFPLFVAYRKVMTALRVYVEMEMFYFKRITPEDAIRLYINIAGFDEQTARDLVNAHLENRGYNLCYLTGYKMIEEFRKVLKDVDEKTFSNKLFSAGFVSMSTLKKILGIKESMPWEVN